VTRPTLRTYADKRVDLLAIAQDLFGAVLSGTVKIEVNQTYPLRDAVKAHQDLQSRKTTGVNGFDNLVDRIISPTHIR
jgi:NADPH2:quinone reductase